MLWSFEAERLRTQLVSLHHVRRLSSNTVETPVEFHRDYTVLNTNLTTSNFVRTNKTTYLILKRFTAFPSVIQTASGNILCIAQPMRDEVTL